MLEWIRFGICAFFMLSGVAVMLTAAIGNLRFKDSLPRMHSGAMADSIGIFCLFTGLLLSHWENMLRMKLVFILLFFWASGPVCSHMLCRFQTNLEKEKQNQEEGEES